MFAVGTIDEEVIENTNRHKKLDGIDAEKEVHEAAANAAAVRASSKTLHDDDEHNGKKAILLAAAKKDKANDQGRQRYQTRPTQHANEGNWRLSLNGSNSIGGQDGGHKIIFIQSFNVQRY